MRCLEKGYSQKVKKWLDDDVERRQANLEETAQPGLSRRWTSLDPASQAERLLSVADTELERKTCECGEVFRSFKELWGRSFPRTESGIKARKRLDELKDKRTPAEVGRRTGRTRRADVSAGPGRGPWSGSTRTAPAMQAYKMLADQHPFSPEGRKAATELRRLSSATESTITGVRLRGESQPWSNRWCRMVPATRLE